MRELDLFSQMETQTQAKEVVAVAVVNNNKSNEVAITSLEIAELTGKEHLHIMRDIRETLNKVVDGGISKFGYTYQHPQNRQFYPAFRLPKREALILVSGYSVELRAKIIDRLEYLENQLKKNTQQIPKSYGEALLEAGRLALEKERLEAQIQAQKPLVEFAESVAQSSNLISIREFAKLLNDENIHIGQNKLFQWFRDRGYLMRNNEPYQKYVDSGYFKIVEQTYKTPYNTNTRLKTLLTGRGQIYFCEKLRVEWKSLNPFYNQITKA